MVIIQNILLLVLTVEVFILARAIGNIEKQISNSAIETELYKTMNDIRLNGYDRIDSEIDSKAKESSLVSAVVPKKNSKKFDRI